MNQLQRIVRTTFYALVTPGHHMPVWVGPPGGGKTECQRALAAALGVKPEHNLDWIGALHPPEDFNGWATPRAEGLRFEAPWSIREVCAAPRGMIFLDELSNMPRATQAGALRFIRERRCGDDAIPETVYMMAAMNPPESAADAQDTSKPLGNRCTWLAFPKIEGADHIAFMANNERAGTGFDLPVFDPFGDEDRARWHRAYAKAVAIYAAFMRNAAHAAALYEDENNEEVMARTFPAWCTPRSWSAVVRQTATCLLFDDLAALPDLAAGTIGAPHGHEWCAFVENADMVDPEEWLKDPTLGRFDPSRPDRLYGELQGLAMAACANGMPEKERTARWHRAWDGIAHVLDLGAPKAYALIATQHMVAPANRPKGQPLAKHEPMIRELAPMVQAAGFWEGAAK